MCDNNNDQLDAFAKSVGIFPLVKYYMDKLNLFELFKKYVPRGKAEIEPAEGLCLMVVNILDENQPLYKVEQWLANYMDGVGEAQGASSKYNDDRLARSCLDGLYEADRNSLMAELSAKAIKIHGLETKRIHNDTTPILLSGNYENSSPQEIKIVKGYNKGGHPNYKQIVFGINVTEDGNVPISYMAFDGNTSDNKTHKVNWNQLREQLGHEDFIYVADSKVCDTENLCHIADCGGKFITIMPATRKEVKEFDETLKREEIPWQEAFQREDSRKRGQFHSYKTYETQSHEGYRIVWVWNSNKAVNDAKLRQNRLKRAETELEKLKTRLNRYNLKTKEQVQSALVTITKEVEEYLTVEIIEQTTIERKQVGRGKPGPDTQFIEQTQTHLQLNWHYNEKALLEASRTDGVFPLMTNTQEEPAEVLRIYKQQPYLEKRHSTLKTIEKVSPVYLKKPQRIEAMLFLYFVGLMVISLIERNLRKQMQDQIVETLQEESKVNDEKAVNLPLQLENSNQPNKQLDSKTEATLNALKPQEQIFAKLEKEDQDSSPKKSESGHMPSTNCCDESTSKIVEQTSKDENLLDLQSNSTPSCVHEPISLQNDANSEKSTGLEPKSRQQLESKSTKKTDDNFIEESVILPKSKIAPELKTDTNQTVVKESIFKESQVKKQISPQVGTQHHICKPNFDEIKPFSESTTIEESVILPKSKIVPELKTDTNQTVVKESTSKESQVKKQILPQIGTQHHTCKLNFDEIESTAKTDSFLNPVSNIVLPEMPLKPQIHNTTHDSILNSASEQITSPETSTQNQPKKRKKSKRLESKIPRKVNESTTTAESFLNCEQDTEPQMESSFKPPNINETPLALPILPQGMKTTTPTFANIKYFFRNVYLMVLTQSEHILKTVLKGITPLHYQVLELLGIPPSAYDNLQGSWWKFQ